MNESLVQRPLFIIPGGVPTSTRPYGVKVKKCQKIQKSECNPILTGNFIDSRVSYYA